MSRLAHSHPPSRPRGRAAALAAAAILAPALLGAPGEAVQGGLVLEGAEVLVVDGGTLAIAGDVLLRGQAALVLRGATLRVDQVAAHEFAIRLRDSAALVLEPGAAITSQHPLVVQVRGRASVAGEGALLGATLDVGQGGSVDAVGTVLAGGLRAHGPSQVRMAGGSVPSGVHVATWDDAALAIDGATLDLDTDAGEAAGSSRVTLRNVTFPRAPFEATGSATLVVEHSRMTLQRSCCSFATYVGTPTVVFRNFTTSPAYQFGLRGGDYTFLGSPLTTMEISDNWARSVTLGDGVSLHGSRFDRVLVVEGGSVLDAASIGGLEVAPGATAALHKRASFLQVLDGTKVEHLLLRSGARLVLGPRLHLADHLNDECLRAQVDPVLDQVVLFHSSLVQPPLVPAPGEETGVLVPGTLNQTLRVRVEDAAGAPVPGATVTLRDALGQAVPVYDPATGATTPQRTTGPGGNAEFAFAPTGVLRVDARGPDGREGASYAVTATCAEATVRLAEA